MRTEREAAQLTGATKARRREKTSVETCGTKTCFSSCSLFALSLSLLCFSSLRRSATMAKDRECHGEERITTGRSFSVLLSTLTPCPCCGSRRYKTSLCSLLMELSAVGDDSAQVADTRGTRVRGRTRGRKADTSNSYGYSTGEKGI